MVGFSLYCILRLRHDLPKLVKKKHTFFTTFQKKKKHFPPPTYPLRCEEQQRRRLKRTFCSTHGGHPLCKDLCEVRCWLRLCVWCGRVPRREHEVVLGTVICVVRTDVAYMNLTAVRAGCLRTFIGDFRPTHKASVARQTDEDTRTKQRCVVLFEKKRGLWR